MKWQKLQNGDYQAQGENGDFLIWKSSQLWKCRYRSKDHKKHFFLPTQKKLSDMKTMCQDNDNWERHKPQKLIDYAKKEANLRQAKILACKKTISQTKLKISK